MPVQQGSLSGGRKLKAIRERQGKSQSLYLDDKEVITQPNYSRIEQGNVRPSRPKLEVILDALEANYNERQEVLKSFGYLPSYPLPELHEIEAACKRCRPVLDAVRMPAYLMDMVTRLLAWNRCFERLLGVHEASSVLNELRYKPLFKAQFDSQVRLGKYIDNIETYLLAEVQGIRKRLAPYREEKWYPGFIEKLYEDAEFRKYWLATEDHTLERNEAVTEFAPRALEPVRFDLPGLDTQVRFYANHDKLLDDERFCVVYLIPADNFTLRQVDRWLGGI